MTNLLVTQLDGPFGGSCDPLILVGCVPPSRGDGLNPDSFLSTEVSAGEARTPCGGEGQRVIRTGLFRLAWRSRGGTPWSMLCATALKADAALKSESVITTA